MLEEIRASYIKTANTIKGWRELDKNTLLNLYIDNEHDEFLKNGYFAAIVIKYWSAIGKYYSDSKNSVNIEECYDWLIHALMYALRNRKWRDPDSAISKDINGPDKIVNRCIASTRQIFYQASNTSKRRANYQADSIERQIEAFGDGAAVLSVCEDTVSNKYNGASAIVEQFILRKDYVSAIISDQIAFQDNFKQEKEKEEKSFLNELGENETQEYYKYSYLFDERKLVKSIKKLNMSYLIYFCSVYKLDQDMIASYMEKLKNSSSNVLYRLIRKCLYDIKNDKLMVDLLCC